MTHTRLQCIERPRKVGAKYTGKDIGRDEILMQVEQSWEAKRDKWNGYDASSYMDVIREHAMKEQIKKEMKAELNKEKMQRRE